MPNDLVCVGIRKAFAGAPALRGVDLCVEAGSFFALVGPSGCGKSTLLRIVGGHEIQDEGTVTLRGVDVSGVPPEKRPVHTVFQQYALFPHLSVEDNVAFPLRMAGVGRRERRARAREALALVRLADHGRRRPATLSGGEKQRVAIARALAQFEGRGDAAPLPRDRAGADGRVAVLSGHARRRRPGWPARAALRR